MAGEVFGQAWGLYKRFWRHFLPIALVIFLVLSVVSVVLGLLFGAFGLFLAFVASLVGIFWLQGALTLAVQDVRDGRVDLSIGETIRRVGPYVGTLLAAGLLAGLGIVIGLALLIAPGLLLATWWALIVPAIVLERKGVFESFGRSRELVRGHGWQVLGVIVLGFLISIGASLLLSLLLIWIPGAGGAYVRNLASNTLITPFIAAAWTLMYFKLHDEQAEPVPVPPGPRALAAVALDRETEERIEQPLSPEAERETRLPPARPSSRCASTCRCAATASCARSSRASTRTSS